VVVEFNKFGSWKALAQMEAKLDCTEEMYLEHSSSVNRGMQFLSGLFSSAESHELLLFQMVGKSNSMVCGWLLYVRTVRCLMNVEAPGSLQE
jgi:hypothetical protein